jgi:predicted secreted hydrolase
MDTENVPETESTQSFGRGFNTSDPAKLGQVADPNYVISFPQDHYSHDTFDIEWWYLTANLEDDEGNPYAIQWTLFRFRDPSQKINSDTQEAGQQWNNQHLYMAHASVHSVSQHWFSEKFARGEVGNAGIQNMPFSLFIDDWQWLNKVGENSATIQEKRKDLLPATLSFNAALIGNTQKTESRIDVQLNLSSAGPYVLQGENGYSVKSTNGEHASHYYSAPFIEVEGIIKSDMTHTHVKGKAWFDQEWTSQLFDQSTLGWDWLSLHLDNGDKIMAFRMRLKESEDYITGTYIQANGSTTTLLPSDISLNVIQQTIVGDKSLPLHWQLNIPQRGLKLKITATKKDQWNPALIDYYEGSVSVSGTHSGIGFMELTGY